MSAPAAPTAPTALPIAMGAPAGRRSRSNSMASNATAIPKPPKVKANASANPASANPADNSDRNVAQTVFRLAHFDHLPRKATAVDVDCVEADPQIHHATVHFGLLLRKGTIHHDDDRAHGLLLLLKTLIESYHTPQNKTLREDLDKHISRQINYLVECRQLAKSMGNIVKFTRMIISKISPDLREAEAKSLILANLKQFEEECMVFALDAIAKNAGAMIRDEDTILTFGSSPVVRNVLLYAATKLKRKFHLVVVDTRPLYEGLETLELLSAHIPCTYTPLSGIAYAMKSVTRVLLGASCVFSNGSMLAPAGTALVAAMAKMRQTPVIVACETYKFRDKVLLDSIVFNELGHFSEIAVALPAEEDPSAPTKNGKNAPSTNVVPQTSRGYRGAADKLSLMSQASGCPDTAEAVIIPHQTQYHNSGATKLPFNVVNLRYDLTPQANISVIATEAGVVPPSSVPVMIREIENELK